MRAFLTAFRHTSKLEINKTELDVSMVTEEQLVQITESSIDDVITACLRVFVYISLISGLPPSISISAFGYCC